jgi:hypothetical protein
MKTDGPDKAALMMLAVLNNLGYSWILAGIARLFLA